MFRKTIAVVLSCLRRPLFGTLVIPRDASVDPALFSEQDYPVYCSKCGYLLRGLADGKCPECGTEFKRGQLLVRNYVTAFWSTSWKGYSGRKWFWRFLAAGFALPFLSILGFISFKPFLDSISKSPATVDLSLSLMRILLAVMNAGTVLQLIAAVIAIKSYPRGSWKRRRAVINAIRQSESPTADRPPGETT